MQEIKKELEQTIKTTCEWVRYKMEDKIMSPDIVAAIPETLKSISDMAETLEKYNKY